jgi:transposase
LKICTTEGDLSIDNNASKNALWCVALGRKDWLLCESDNSGHTAAVLFSFIASCGRHKIDPFAYRRDVLERISAVPVSRLPELVRIGGKPLGRLHRSRQRGERHLEASSGGWCRSASPEMAGTPDAYKVKLS